MAGEQVIVTGRCARLGSTQCHRLAGCGLHRVGTDEQRLALSGLHEAVEPGDRCRRGVRDMTYEPETVPNLVDERGHEIDAADLRGAFARLWVDPVEAVQVPERQLNQHIRGLRLAVDARAKLAYGAAIQ